MIQTLCPYGLVPLTSGESNNEHIVPLALGAPDDFTVRALTAENSRMNGLIDGPTTNHSLIRLIAASQGVVSRSGPVKAVVEGSDRSSGEKVKVTLSKGSRHGPTFLSPVDTDSDGRVIGVRGFGDAARQRATEIVKNYARKGTVAQLGGERTETKPLLDMALEGSEFMIRRQLCKIAYLTTVRVFGNEAITGPSGQQLRAAMMAESAEALERSGIAVFFPESPPPGLARSTGHAEHAITCALMPGTGIVTSVDLFGAFTLFAVTPADGISADEGAGEVIIINTASSKLTSRPFVEAAQDLVAAAFRG